jgi:hypothetical protein
MRAARRIPQQFGTQDVGVSRYFALYLAQAGWLLLGGFLAANATWPSSCTPGGLIEAYVCSIRLPENRGWIEAALLTWMWATPLLAGLEISRRLNAPKKG